MRQPQPDPFVQQHLGLKSMWDRARRTQQGLFTISAVSTLISWGQAPASLVRSREEGNVPLRALHPKELFPPEAALSGDGLSGRSARKFS